MLYDTLRWAETLSDAKYVLIANFFELEKDIKCSKDLEHRDALFDRIFRATSGKTL